MLSNGNEIIVYVGGDGDSTNVAILNIETGTLSKQQIMQIGIYYIMIVSVWQLLLLTIFR